MTVAEPGVRRSWVAIFLRAVGVVAVLLLGGLLALALVPASVGGAQPAPDPASSYADAAARFDAVVAAEGRESVFAPCRSRLLDHGRRTKVAVVLLHGLSSCPRQLAELGEEIHALGANVLILRAPRHGVADRSGKRVGDVSNLAGLTAGELRAYGDEAVDISAGLGDDVRVFGLSMGGVVAAWAAQNRSEVGRVVVASPELGLPHVPGFVDSAFRNLFSRLPNVSLPGSSAVVHAYAGESTSALAAVYGLGESVRRQAAETDPAAASIVVVRNAGDDQVDNGDSEALTDAWRGHGADVSSYEFTEELGLPHDFVDVRRPGAQPDRVYPVLLGLLGFGG